MKEAYCSYEVSELLKKKGFDEECTHYYSYEDNELIEYTNGVYSRNSKDCHRCTSPTHQMAIKWLREEKNILIHVYPVISDKDYKIFWCCSVNILYENCISTKWYQCYIETYEEATETAIKYCLEHLI